MAYIGIFTNLAVNRAFMSEDELISKRKLDHLSLAEESVVVNSLKDDRFYYEPLMGHHLDDGALSCLQREFAGKMMSFPIWVSSMTGGASGQVESINKRLAEVVAKYDLGIGLGSCRVLLESGKFFDDFNLRPILGSKRPFYANLGIAQVDELIAKNEINKLEDMCSKLDVNGIIIHINPLQEWLQPEGDRFLRPPIIVLKDFVDKTNLSIIVKEVGQGIGPKSLEALLKLPIDAIELAGFGGTNFSKLELLRTKGEQVYERESFSRLGHNNIEMIEYINSAFSVPNEIKCTNFIISGGIENCLDGYYLMKKLGHNSIYGQARKFLHYAEKSYKELDQFVAQEIEGLKFAEQFLKVKV